MSPRFRWSGYFRSRVRSQNMRKRAVFFMIGRMAMIAGGALQMHVARAEQFQVPAELWDRPRTGQVVLAVPAVRQALNALLASPETRLTVHYPPGAESASQAEEMRAWLVAHAVEPTRIALRDDLQARQALQLEVGR